MKLIKNSLVLAVLLTASSCKNDGGGKVKANLTDENSKVFYSLGFMSGSRFTNFKLTDAELNNVFAGMADAANGSKEQVKTADYRMKISELFQKRMAASSVKVKEAGKKYLEEFVAKGDGAIRTTSGLAYKISKTGTNKPKATDKVKVHYVGKLIDGTEFDSSVKRGTPATFPLNRVIKGWTEGIQLLGVGGKMTLVIPSELGYGDNGAPPKIPGGSTLVFEVELLEIVKDAPKGAKKAIKKAIKKLKK